MGERSERTLNFEVFLSKDNTRKYQFLRFIEESTDLAAKSSLIQEKLGISNFLYDKTLGELQNDFIEFNLDGFFELVTDKEQVQLNESQEAVSDLVLREYLKDSLDIAILLDLLKGNFQSIHDFANQHFINYRIAYEKVKEVKKILASFGIGMNKNHQLTSSNQNIFFFFTKVTSFLFQEDFSFYGQQIEEKINAISQKLKDQEIFIPLTRQRRLEHFFGVFFLLKDLKIDQNKNKKTVLQSLRKSFPGEENCLKELELPIELEDDIFSFLYLEGILTESTIEKNIIGKRITRLNDRFISAFEKNFYQLDPQKEIVLFNELNRLHFEMLYFPFRLFDGYDNIDISFFEETYTEYFLFCRKYLMDQSYIKKEGIIDYRNVLFLTYLLILVENISLSEVIEQINVYIDFSFGQKYNRFIANNLSIFSHLNVVTQDKLTEETDLVISNISELYHSNLIENIIWLDPPRPTDWANLGKTLLQIRAKKFN
ncbi:helix-turn-helix domain-containing protein [Enterococcus sp. AZ103]|uniref:helix-turn-helix domain-containing protein n=1 Tax=Enterococcus sp. AZ103 TaxID=2774628 RepID=UPI003F27EE7F